MGTVQRAAALGSADARRALTTTAAELRPARIALGMSQRDAARRAGMSQSEYGRIERGQAQRVRVDQLLRAGRAVALVGRLAWFPADEAAVRDAGQLPLLSRLEVLLATPLRLRREVPLPMAGDGRAWDARIEGGERPASVEAESKLTDIQALARRIALKQRDDPDAGPVILVVNRTAHNRRVLAEHREALRAQLPLDGAAIARALRAGRVPDASGIILL